MGALSPRSNAHERFRLSRAILAVTRVFACFLAHDAYCVMTDYIWRPIPFCEDVDLYGKPAVL
jgi:hypothetical protein